MTEELPKELSEVLGCPILWLWFLFQSKLNDWNIDLLEQQSSVKLLSTAFVTHDKNWMDESFVHEYIIWGRCDVNEMKNKNKAFMK